MYVLELWQEVVATFCFFVADLELEVQNEIIPLGSMAFVIAVRED